MLEKHIEKTCVNLAKKQGFETRKVKFIASNGAPDRIFFKKGRFIWVEFKTTGGVVSELQKAQINKLREAGQEVYIIFSIDDFKEIICLKEQI